MTGSGAENGIRSRQEEALAYECRALARYLAGVEATDYVVSKYWQALQELPSLRPRTRFDEILLLLARGPSIARWPAAAFARVHAPDSALQNRLVTLLAILESSPGTSKTIDLVPTTSTPLLIGAVGLRIGLGGIALIIGTVVLLPLRWVTRERAVRT